MATIWKLRGRVVELGESSSDSVNEMKDGRRRQVHLCKYAFIVIEDDKGVRHELPSCTVMGQAALYELDVGADIELLYGGPIPATKKQSSGIGRSTIVYAMRLVDVTGWMGDDVQDLTGAMAWELWKAALLCLALAPVVAIGTFFAGGIPGLYCLWLSAKAARGALKLSSVSDVSQAIDQAKRELGAQPTSAQPTHFSSEHDLLKT